MTYVSELCFPQNKTKKNVNELRNLLCNQLKEALSISMDLAVGGGLFRDLRDSLLDGFSCDSICNISRVCNSLGHNIARRGLGWDPGQSEVWTDFIPEFVISLCAREFAEHVSINERP